MEINGLPAHVLVVHATVVLVPLAALLSIAYAVVPRWRWAARWPMVGAALAALGVVVAAYYSGKDFLEGRLEQQSVQEDAILTLHQERAEVLLWVTICFVAVVFLAAWGMGGPSPLVSGRGARGRHTPLIEMSALALTVVFAVTVILMIVQTGEAGAESAWGDIAF